MRDEAVRKGAAAGRQRRKGIRLRIEPGNKKLHASTPGGSTQFLSRFDLSRFVCSARMSGDSPQPRHSSGSNEWQVSPTGDIRAWTGTNGRSRPKADVGNARLWFQPFWLSATCRTILPGGREAWAISSWASLAADSGKPCRQTAELPRPGTAPSVLPGSECRRRR